MITGLDCETFLGSNAEPVPRLVSVCLASAGYGVELYVAHDPRLPSRLLEVFAGVVAIANAPFDLHVLWRAFPELFGPAVYALAEDRIADVLTREKLIDIANGERERGRLYNLGAVAQRRIGAEIDKNDPWRKRYGELAGLEVTDWPAEAVEYAIKDGAAHLAVYTAQEAFRREHLPLDVFADAGRQARGHVGLYSQTLRGILTDQPRVEALDALLADQIDDAQSRCIASGLARIGGTKKCPKVVRSIAAAQEALLQWTDQTGIRLQRTEPTAKHPDGQISLSDDALKAARVPDDHPLADYRALGSLGTKRSKNIPILRRPIVRTRYDECVESGRTSSSKPQGKKAIDKVEPWEWVGTNLQNLDRSTGFRECLIPPPGFVFLISDWSGAELVALAQVQLDLFGRSALADMMRQGRDPHAEFACQILGIAIEDFDKSNPAHKDARQGAKAWNFGKPGGMGRARFIQHARDVYGFVISEEQEREYTARWRAMFPEMDEFFDYVRTRECADGSHTVIQPRSGRIRGGMGFTDACNTHFQGLAADAAKTALWRLWLAGHDPTSPLYGAAPAVSADGNVPRTGQVLFVHDENVTQVPADRAPAALAEQERIMVEAFAEWCPDVPIKVESAITERYTK